MTVKNKPLNVLMRVKLHIEKFVQPYVDWSITLELAFVYLRPIGRQLIDASNSTVSTVMVSSSSIQYEHKS